MRLVFITLLLATSYNYSFTSASQDAGDPLFLTTFVETGNIQQGQAAAKVVLPGSNEPSYAGYFTVNKSCNSNLFFWYFPAEAEPDNAPVIVWLQGGPGASSMNGLFNENGPFFIDDKGHTRNRNTSWSKIAHMIYIDNPVGTGFSFTDNEHGYTRNEVDVGRDLYSTLHQFFTLFPHLQPNNFFIAGESYAGKYVPAAAFAIHNNNYESNLKINLKGLMMGDGWTAPEYMLGYGDYLFQLGLIDYNGKRMFKELQQQAINFIKAGEYVRAKNVVDSMVSDFNPHSTLYYNLTGLESCYNYVLNNDTNPDFTKFLLSDEVRKGIHVGNMTFQNGDDTAKYLENDIMQSVKPWIETLLEKYRVLFYNGQLDIICAYPLTVNVLQHLEWSGANLYKRTTRKQWLVDGVVAGYSKTIKGLTEVLIRNSGHVVPKDQPEWALDLITRFVYNKPL